MYVKFPIHCQVYLHKIVGIFRIPFIEVRGKIPFWRTTLAVTGRVPRYQGKFLLVEAFHLRFEVCPYGPQSTRQAQHLMGPRADFHVIYIVTTDFYFLFLKTTNT